MADSDTTSPLASEFAGDLAAQAFADLATALAEIEAGYIGPVRGMESAEERAAGRNLVANALQHGFQCWYPLDPARPLEAQSDSFWWSGGAFHSIAEPYGDFRRILRGFDPSHAGFAVTDYTATLDGGCGFGGTLIAACVTPDGALVDKIEV